MNVVLKLSKSQQSNLTKKFDRYKLSSKNEYLAFFAKVGKTTISLYTSGKCVFQGEQAEKIASEFGEVQLTEKPKMQANLIGTDEVGNGSYFGGLVVVASYLTADDIDFLTKIGVADSKKLTDDKINQIAPILMEKIAHTALIVPPKKYNQVIDSGYNAVSIKVALHNQAIFLLLNKLDEKPQAIVIDAFTTEKNWQKYVKNEKNQVSEKLTLLTKAEDQYLAVAASSVIARHLFLSNLTALSDEAGQKLPSGAGNLSDKVAADLIKKKGFNSLENFVKLHFANTEKAKKLAN